MAIRNIPINLPDGKEDFYMEVFALANAWTPESGISAAVHGKKVVADKIKEDITNYLIANSVREAKLLKQEELNTVIIN